MSKRFIDQRRHRLRERTRRSVTPLVRTTGRLAFLAALAVQVACAGAAPEAPAPERQLAGVAQAETPSVSGRNADRFGRATTLLRDGRLVEAEVLLLELTADQPELAGPWINLAQVYLAQARDAEATSALERAVAANPGNCAARVELGVQLRRRGDFAAAETHYLACVEYQPDYQAAYLNLGILYELYLGRLADALAAYRQYQALAVSADRRVDGWVMDLERRVGT